MEQGPLVGTMEFHESSSDSEGEFVDANEEFSNGDGLCGNEDPTNSKLTLNLSSAASCRSWQAKEGKMWLQGSEQIPVIPRSPSLPNSRSGNMTPEDPSLMTSEDLVKAIQLTCHVTDLFFNNEFKKAKALLKAGAGSSFYPALGYGVIMCLEAVMTMSEEDIQAALHTMKNSIEVCQRFRKKQGSLLTSTMSRMVRFNQVPKWSEVEAHAELCYSECYLLKAVLTFIEDENLISFVKAGLQIRSAYGSYKDCWTFSQSQNLEWSKYIRENFVCGVKLGVGGFNLLLSLLPQRVLRLLEWIGFSGSRTFGLRQLEDGQKCEGSIRQTMCRLIIAGYHLFVTFLFGIGDGDLQQAASILTALQAKYPSGAFPLFLAGRLKLVEGNFEEAVKLHHQAWHSQDQWVQFHHFCFWEIMWSHMYLCEWERAAEFAQKLFKESRWSPCVYAYSLAILLLEIRDPTPEQEKERNELMRKVPSYRQRIAGKSIPLEKFAGKKSERYFAQGEKLVLPSLEAIYLHNGFLVIGKRKDLLESILDNVSLAQESLEKGNTYYVDNWCLTMVLRGMCLRYLKRASEAEVTFAAALQKKDEIQDDTYLPPYITAELGFLHLELGNLVKAKSFLESAKSDYKGFSLESRLHFRIHAALKIIRQQEKGVSTPDMPQEFAMA